MFEEEFIEFFGDIPEDVKSIGKTYITFKDGNKITMQDVARYYAFEARNISSGCRQLGDLVGDWRPIDNLASTLHEWFKYININQYRATYNQYSDILTPQF